jgi:lysophospholipase L1-like esterase
MRSFTLGLLAALLVLASALTPAAASTAHQTGGYAALGDSYAAGLGAGGEGSAPCYRSDNAYPALWAAAHGVGLAGFVACSGATTADVLAGQLGALGPGTDLVTVTVGGNDIGFADVMRVCSLSTDQACLDRIAQSETVMHGALPGGLDAVYGAVHEHAPNARLVVLGYPRLFETGICLTSLSQRKRIALNAAADELAEVIAGRAQADGATFVDVRPEFAGHGVCALLPWIHSLTYPVSHSYHPTATGQRLGYLDALTAVTG